MPLHIAAACALGALLVSTNPPYEPLAARLGAPRVVVDDRPIKDQAGAASLATVVRTLADKGLAVAMLRDYAAHEMGAADRAALKHCGDNTGCVAPLLGKAPHFLVTLRVTMRGAAQVVALSRTSTLRPQDEENEGGVVADAGAAAALVRDLLDALFPQQPESSEQPEGTARPTPSVPSSASGGGAR